MSSRINSKVETRPPESPPDYRVGSVNDPLFTSISAQVVHDTRTDMHKEEMHGAIPTDKMVAPPIPTPTVAALPPPDTSSQHSGDAQAPTKPEREKDPIIWHCTSSQYSFEQGRSACTCIALSAATAFLRNSTMSSEFLEHMILDGLHTYSLISQSFPTEHLNVEEVLQLDARGEIFPLQMLPGGIRQGVLSYDCDHPLGLRALLHGIQHEKEAMVPDQWLALLLTKTPETVLVCLPPNSRMNITNQVQQYYLIDSHPRPQQDVGTAYALAHSSLDSLVGSLEKIFPYTYMEPDVPEMMAMMYNSFDVYPVTMRPDTNPSNQRVY
eukprot:Nitzschia sp. Nitz4//scaffold147_size54853//16626//17600//NITZ4_006613-RA/size54853-processed-gene-0.20-mRNA-1//-1//CDS//3329536681//6771//frame0